MSEHRAIPEANIDTVTIYNRLSIVEVGDVVTYSELSHLIGRDVCGAARGCMTSAVRRALNDGRVFAAVRNVGYRLLPDDRIASVGISAVAHIRRSAKRAARKLACVREFDRLPNDKKIEHNTGLSVLGAIAQCASAPAVKRVSRAVEHAKAQLPLARTLEAFRG
jgi:alkylated DNA nucleotide flippase Atl1